MHTLQQLLSGELAGTKRLKLSCGLTEVPPQVFDLAATLEILDLSGNRLRQLPPELERLKKLKVAFFSDNEFTEFPAVLGKCPQLEMIGFKANKISTIPENALPPKIRWLILTNNRIEALPESAGNWVHMQKLMLAGNKLKRLPEGLAACKRLELLRISANELEVLPGWLFALPRLSWLACSGNPFSSVRAVADTLPPVPWHSLKLQEQLGEGASGLISKAIWQKGEGAAGQLPVAVKVFKGEVTSDGLPADEMAACMAAGAHPNLVQVLGRLVGHPEQKHGLVLGLIPPSYQNLGQPPSFESCTRDVYPAGTCFSLQEALKIATAMADAAAHLHARGIMHGDLYAHNILTDAAAHLLFGDFGAATLYNREDETVAPYFECLEVRAFGCLLEDLLNHLLPAAIDKPEVAQLRALKDSCLQEAIRLRPPFTTILEQLQEIATAGLEQR